MILFMKEAHRQSLMEGFVCVVVFEPDDMRKMRSVFVSGAEGRKLSLQNWHLPENATLSQIF